MTDQLRLDCISPNGNEYIQTPNIDALAQTSTNFSNSYCTLPICQPSRVSIITGRYPSEHGTVANGIKYQKRYPILPQILNDHGYETLSSGKMHFNPIASDFDTPPHEPGEVDSLPYMGFQKVYSVEGIHSDYLRMIEKHHPKLLKAANHKPGYDSTMPFEAYPTPIPLELHRSTCITDSAIRLLEERDKEKPFFMHLSYWDPHHPFDPPHPYDKLYENKPVHEPISHSEASFRNLPPHFQEWYTHIWKQEGKPFCEHTPEDWKKIIRLYYSMITLIDDGIGRLMRTLQDEGIFDDTIIIFSSDHGELLGDHGIATKGKFFYQGLIQVPLIIKLVAQTQSKIITTPVMNFDIMPTLLDVLGIEPPEMTAVSLLPLLEGSGKFEQPIYIEGEQGKMVCLVSYPYKIIAYADTPMGQLYNLEEDPNEYNNLWDEKAHTHILELVKTQLKLFTKGGNRESLW